MKLVVLRLQWNIIKKKKYLIIQSTANDLIAPIFFFYRRLESLLGSEKWMNYWEVRRAAIIQIGIERLAISKVGVKLMGSR